MPTGDVKIVTAHIRVEIYYTLISYELFSKEQKECYKGTRGTGELRATRAKRDGKCRFGVDCIQKSIRYDPSKLDYRLSENVQNIRRSHKVYRPNHRKLESGTDSNRKKFS